jgi:hypothetical protein
VVRERRFGVKTRLQPTEAQRIALPGKEIGMQRAVKREWIIPKVKGLEAGKAESGSATEEDGEFTAS